MAKTIKVICDRCNKEIHYPVDIERKIWLSGKGREGGLDLCDECYNEMFKWFMQYHTDEVKIPENEDNYFPNKETIIMSDEEYDKMMEGALCEECTDEDMGEVSDGYHTFNQLYHQRAILFATIVNQNKDRAWKSYKHEDGKYCFDKDGEWFIVGIDTPLGSYTYHYSKEYWDYFNCEELECGKPWDGHTEEDVTRLLSLSSVIPQPKKGALCADNETGYDKGANVKPHKKRAVSFEVVNKCSANISHLKETYGIGMSSRNITITYWPNFDTYLMTALVGSNNVEHQMVKGDVDYETLSVDLLRFFEYIDMAYGDDAEEE